MTPCEQIDELIAGITDWRGKTFASLRKTILEADKEIAEERKCPASSSALTAIPALKTCGGE